MALPLFRGCCRLSVSHGLNRLYATERLHLIQSHRPRCPASAAGVSQTFFRPYSSDRDKTQMTAILSISNPYLWFRSKIYCFLIRAYFDNDFTMDEFREGAKQAFSHVSSLLSESQFQALDGLVASDLVSKLEETCKSLPMNYRRALFADPEEIICTDTNDMGIYYDDNDRKFVSISVKFIYLSSVGLPKQASEGSVFDILNQEDTKSPIWAQYDFQREFTKGVEPDWTITQIKHQLL